MNDYRKLEKQPLKFVLAEFRFSPVMQISEFIPRIQEALRQQYPISHKSSEQTIQVQAGGIAVSSIDRWAFVSANKKSAVDVNQERLVYITADYPRFDGFAQACRQAVEVLSGVVNPGLILRIGLRYSDLVKVDDGEHISDLVNKHFTYPENLTPLGSAQQQRNETYLQTTMGGLVIRTLYGQHHLTCLPDMHGLPISIDHDNVPSERVILDFDHFWEAKEESVSFETNDIVDKLGKLHETSREAFWKITTDYARNEKWA